MVKDVSKAPLKDLPRVLQVLPALEGGGVEKATLDWLKVLRQQFPAVPLFVASKDGKLVSFLQDLNVTHFPLPLDTKNPVGLVKNAWALFQLIKTHHIQLVHARSRAPAWSAFWATHWLNVPFLTTYHGAYGGHNWLKRLYNSVMVRGNQTIAISKFIALLIQTEHKALNPNVVVIPEGIDTDYFDPQTRGLQTVASLRQTWGVNPDQVLILLPGRLTRWKGQEVLAKALRLLPSLPFCAVFLGSDQGRTAYKSHLQTLTQDLNVQFIDECPDMPTAYAAADLVLSCSTQPEAFGRITAEALAMGRPFIGTNLGATPELCLNQDIGF